MNNILLTLKPKEVINYYTKLYLVDFLSANGFIYKENQLAFHKNLNDFKQVVYFSCSRNNISRHIIDFGLGFYLHCPQYKTWYKKQYGKETSPLISGHEINMDKWNGNYQRNYYSSFGYDLINFDIEHQFYVILENLQNCILPYFKEYETFDDVISKPKLYEITSTEITGFGYLKQIEHCLFLNKYDRAKELETKLVNMFNKLNPIHVDHLKTELIRIFSCDAAK